MNRKLILITGIPGTGKTTIGDLLESDYGYKHYNFEEQKISKKLHQYTDKFIDEVSHGEKVVVTWGFQPYWHYRWIVKLQDRGFKMIWIDGNRVIAYNYYKKRGGDESAFYQQLNNITNSKIIELLNPYMLNPFIKNGSFRDKKEIVDELFHQLD